MSDSPAITSFVKFHNGNIKCILEVEIMEVESGFTYTVEGTAIKGFVTELKQVNKSVTQEFERILASQNNYKIVETMKSRGL